MDAKTLTPEQIKNWRTVLCGMLGPYAIIMQDSQIQAITDNMQRKLDSLPQEEDKTEIPTHVYIPPAKQKPSPPTPMQNDKPKSAMEIALNKALEIAKTLKKD